MFDQIGLVIIRSCQVRQQGHHDHVWSACNWSNKCDSTIQNSSVCCREVCTISLMQEAKPTFIVKNIGVLQHRPRTPNMSVKLNLISFVDSPTRFAHFCSAVHLPEPQSQKAKVQFWTTPTRKSKVCNLAQVREPDRGKSKSDQAIRSWISTSQSIEMLFVTALIQ